MLIRFMVNPGVIKRLLVPGGEEVCGPSPLCSCSVPQALGVSVERKARGDESGVKKGNVHRDSWQGTTRSSDEHLSSAQSAAKVMLPSRQSCS